VLVFLGFSPLQDYHICLIYAPEVKELVLIIQYESALCYTRWHNHPTSTQSYLMVCNLDQDSGA
jgi:hypothetical protein